MNLRVGTSVGGQDATTPRLAFSKRISGSNCPLWFLRLLGLSQKQQGFGLRHPCALDTSQSPENLALNRTQSLSHETVQGEVGPGTKEKVNI